MKQVMYITLKGIFRDRVFQGIMMLAVIFPLVPMIASFSMRQVTELAITLTLSLFSFILLLLSVFLGATSIWKDIDHRNAISVLSLPINRTSYLIGRFFGISLFIVIVAILLGFATMMDVKIASSMYPPARPISWEYICLAVTFITFRSILLVAVAMLLSTVSTSFFLPIFGTIIIYITGTTTQQVYDFIHTETGTNSLSPLIINIAMTIYYLLPNLSSFDYKVNAIYNIAPDTNGIFLTFFYFIIYSSILLGCGALLIERREIK